jgi:hypothetical protein
VARTVGSGWNNPSVPALIAGYGDPVRDTLIAAPACGKNQDMPVMAANDPRGNEPLSPTSDVVREGEQAAGGIPSGARSILEKVSRTASDSARQRQQPPEARASDGAGGSR